MFLDVLSKYIILAGFLIKLNRFSCTVRLFPSDTGFERKHKQRNIDAGRNLCTGKHLLSPGYFNVRRYLLDAIPKGKKMDYTLPAVQGAMYVDKLFHLEKEIKKKHNIVFQNKNRRCFWSGWSKWRI